MEHGWGIPTSCIIIRYKELWICRNGMLQLPIKYKLECRYVGTKYVMIGMSQSLKERHHPPHKLLSVDIPAYFILVSMTNTADDSLLC